VGLVSDVVLGSVCSGFVCSAFVCAPANAESHTVVARNRAADRMKILEGKERTFAWYIYTS
jgi:hypothetical protein